MNRYETMIHNRCPVQPVWDYMTVAVETRGTARVEAIEEVCEAFRGGSWLQEEIANKMFSVMKNKFGDIPFMLTIQCQHGQNCKLKTIRGSV